MNRFWRWPAYAVRAFSIFAVALILSLAYGLFRLGTLVIWPRERRLAVAARGRGRLLRWGMTTLGATFIKLGQVMSTRPDLFPPEMIDELRRLQDQLPAFSYRRARIAIEAELGKSVEELFVEIDSAPVAAASVAQVHRARTSGGDLVAVKVLRPNVRAQIERDAIILSVVARIAALGPRLRLSDPVGHLREFLRGIREQTDLRLEASHYDKFRNNFRDTSDISFPRVFRELSSERVLTMEFIEGVKVDALGPGNHKDIARACRVAFLRMCFEHGFVHSDLHPGNMLVTADRRLVIFDAGLAKELGDHVLDQFVDFSKCIALGTVSDFMHHFRTFHTYLEGTDWAALEREAEVFIAKWRHLTSAQIEFGGMINELLALARKYRIQPIPELTLVLVGIVTAEGISKILDPDLDMFRQMGEFLLPIVARRGLAAASR